MGVFIHVYKIECARAGFVPGDQERCFRGVEINMSLLALRVCAPLSSAMARGARKQNMSVKPEESTPAHAIVLIF
ncbi:hypothetical protein AO065_12685 [Pseudomonas viridiflava]|uniref:hypothetical protein n=1 Tax=Pseudomonas viridiflava TaxID=33069 RepID=UPI000291A71D|nr:hypothetical protein [Pseudomonas viridiflava]EKN46056.1 hypothetical protein AAI_13510 [Pseudomonas viridiflava UASWS0038]KPL64260.1 hypothetical protein PVFL_12895 [Pseudomonas viridiflava]OAG89583.1 hypothetical protein AO065_12685 [Pseudomonas viridiflava]